jgi:ubiquinone/menaquinone biosynthesis C-methylase UbiE
MLEIVRGSSVADVGCHEGYMTFKLAREVGKGGKVYAVDLSQSKLDKVMTRAGELGYSHIEAIKGEPDNPKLPDNALDAVIILDTYHEIDAHAQVLQHIRRALKPGGRLLICEPIAEERKNLSRNEQESKHELALSFALDDLRKAGFKVVYQKDNFIDRTKEKGDRMWVIVGQKI